LSSQDVCRRLSDIEMRLRMVMGELVSWRDLLKSMEDFGAVSTGSSRTAIAVISRVFEDIKSIDGMVAQLRVAICREMYEGDSGDDAETVGASG